MEALGKPILRVLIVCLLISMGIQWFQWDQNVSKVPAAIKGHATVFREEMDTIMPISCVDTTKEYIYYAYSTIGVVAIYSKTGEYLCSYAFFDTNGTLTIRCHEGKLYVNDHANYEFVFDGTQMLEVRSPAKKEYVFGWYAEERTLDIFIERGAVYDINGNFIMTLPGKLHTTLI